MVKAYSVCSRHWNENLKDVIRRTVCSMGDVTVVFNDRCDDDFSTCLSKREKQRNAMGSHVEVGSQKEHRRRS